MPITRGHFWFAISLVILALVAWPTTHVGAQGAAGSSIGLSVTGGTCASPQAGQTFLCGLANDIQMSFNGAPYATIQGKTGPQGPAGATGATGAQGPQGIQGPPGTGFTAPVCVTLTADLKGNLLVTPVACH